MWKKNPCLTPILAGRDKCCSLVTLFVSQPLRAKRLREKQQVPHPADNSNLSHPTPLVIPTEAYPDFSNASWQATQRNHSCRVEPLHCSNSHPATKSVGLISLEIYCCNSTLRKRVGQSLIRRGWFLRVASQEGFEKSGGHTADPSTSLRFGRDDKGRGVAQVGVVSGMGRKSRSTSLRFGRDDKVREVAQVGVVSGMERNYRSL
jgi:hypothetical protein